MSTTSPSPSTSDKAGQAADQAKDKAGQVADQARDKAGQVADQAKAKVGQVQDQATAKADQGLDKASEGLGGAADKLREQAEGDGPVPAQAAMVADRLDQVSGYFKDKDTNQIVSDLEAFVREKPVESLIGAVAIGFVLAKLVR